MLHVTGRVLASAQIPAGARVLDLGCGSGLSSLAVYESLCHARAAPRAVVRTRITGVDSSVTMLASAKARGIPGFEGVQADALDHLRSCPTDSFDVVCAFWSLGYLSSPDFYREVRRVLRPGGAFLFAANTADTFPRVFDWGTLYVLEHPAKVRHGARLRCPDSAARLRASLTDAGLRVATLREHSRAFRFASGREAAHWLRGSGLLCGCECLLDDADWDEFFRTFEENGPRSDVCRYVTGIAVAPGRGDHVEAAARDVQRV
jgi:SAM-dependent methyltransferase